MRRQVAAAVEAVAATRSALEQDAPAAGSVN
jgi:hypothetical protein